jgi:S-adenosylmethionine/arginine decarboxylase-like enzyme
MVVVDPERPAHNPPARRQAVAAMRANVRLRRRRSAGAEHESVELLSPTHNHLTAEFAGVPLEHLRDTTLLGGLLIAAANAGGFNPIGVPTVKTHKDGGVSAILLLDGAHLALHSIPSRQTLLFDAVAPTSHDFRKVLEVIARRLPARDIKSDTRARG